MQTREEFLADRRTGIGGSDIAGVLNIGYGCSLRLFNQKRGIEPDYPEEQNDAMALGQFLEPFFADKYAKQTGRPLTVPEIMHHPDHPELFVHADRMIVSGYVPGPFDMGVLEIKSLGRATFWRTKREGLADDYSLQLQHAMLVTGATWGSFAIGSRDSGELLWWDVMRDEKLIDRILVEALRFWVQVENGPAPEKLDPDDKRCQQCGYRGRCHGDGFIGIAPPPEYEQDDSLAPLVAEYLERRALRKEAVELFDETKEELATRMGQRGKVMAAGNKIQHYSFIKKEYVVPQHEETPLRVYPPKGK